MPNYDNKEQRPAVNKPSLPPSVMTAMIEDVSNSDDPYDAAVKMAVDSSRNAKKKDEAGFNVSATMCRLEAEYALLLAQHYE